MNRNLPNRVRDLRTRKGFSQEQLSEEAKISLRTVQRIEKGESVPRGDTLLKLSEALKVTPDDLLEPEKTEDRGFLSILNLSALSVVLHPILGILLPLVLWILKREKVNLVDDTGKKLISFEITWVMTLYLIFIIVSQGAYIPFNFNILKSFFIFLHDFSLAAMIIIAMYLFNLILVLLNVRRNQKGIKSKYIPAIRFLK